MNAVEELIQVQQKPISVTKNGDPRELQNKYVHDRNSPVHTDPPSSTLPPNPATVSTPCGAPPSQKKAHLSLLAECLGPSRFEWSEEEVLPESQRCWSESLTNFGSLSYNLLINVEFVKHGNQVILEGSVDKMPSSIPVIQHDTKKAQVSKKVGEQGDDNCDDILETICNLDDDIEEKEPTDVKINSLNTPTIPILITHKASNSLPRNKVRFAYSMKNELLVNNKLQTSLQPSAKPIPESTTSCVPALTAAPLKSLAAVTSPLTNITTNHTTSKYTKIIDAIIKKYPDLEKNSNKKIQFKIKTRAVRHGNAVQNKDEKVKNKFQYFILKSDLINIKKELKNEVFMRAENQMGPWFCVVCGNDKDPIKFMTYYTYRKHLEEVHNERIDPKICEHCGLKSSKRNLHLHHLYTKHNIPPPRNVYFPKCEQCGFIALNEMLLMKHQSNHTQMMSKEFVCQVCNAAFKSNGALMCHKQKKLHLVDQAPKKDYKCEYCDKVFNRIINMKAHIRVSHQESNRKMYEYEDGIDDPPEEQVIHKQENQNITELLEVPVFESISGGDKTPYLPQGTSLSSESPSVSWLPHSKSEVISNVSNGKVKSINITDTNTPNNIFVIDDYSVITCQGSTSTNDLKPYSDQEYIVPKLIADFENVYTTELINSTPSTELSYISRDNILLINSTTDHTYKNEMKVNGNVNTRSYVSPVSSNRATVIASQIQVSHANQPTIMDLPIIISEDWVQPITTSQAQCLNLSVPMVNSGAQVDNVTLSRKAQTLINDWGDLEEDNQEDCKDVEDETYMKPSRLTIELDDSSDMDLLYG